MADHHELRDEPAVHVQSRLLVREGVAVHDGKVARPIPWWGS